MTQRTIYIYLINHDRRDIKTHTYIGAAYDFRKRLDQHNGIIPGGPRITKKAAGYWEPVFVLRMFGARKLSSKVLKREWKSSSRGLESRIRKGFELSVKHNLQCYIMKSPKNKSVEVLRNLKLLWKNEEISLSKTEMLKIINGDA
jgi:hypothetical protein